MIWEQMVGHRPQIEMFRRAVGRQRLGQGYLLVGPPGVGKQLFARLLTQCLFCERVPDAELDACGDCASCRQMQAGHHPDLLTIGLPEGKRTLPISLLVGEDNQRGRSGLCYDISMAPMSASRRVAIINNAESMSEEAVNSLLKTLEEPPVGSILFLILPDLDQILPTIRSRCQPIHFEPLSTEHLITLLQAQGLDTEGMEAMISLAEGSLDVARQLMEPELRKLWTAVEKHLTARTLDSRRALQDVTAVLEEIGGDTATQREYMHWVVRFCINSLRSQFTNTEDVQQWDRLGIMLDRCFEAEMHLQQSMPVPLCLEAMFTELGKRSRLLEGSVR